MYTASTLASLLLTAVGIELDLQAGALPVEQRREEVGDSERQRGSGQNRLHWEGKQQSREHIVDCEETSPRFLAWTACEDSFLERTPLHGTAREGFLHQRGLLARTAVHH